MEKIFPVLELLSRVKDVRELIPKIINNNRIEYNQAIEILQKEILYINIDEGLLQNKNSEKYIKNKNIKIDISQPKKNNINKLILRLKEKDKDKEEIYQIETKSKLLKNHPLRQSQKYLIDKSDVLIHDETNTIGKKEDKSIYNKKDILKYESGNLNKYLIFNTPTRKNSTNKKLNYKKTSVNDSYGKNEPDSSQHKMLENANSNRIIYLKLTPKYINRAEIKKHASLINFEGLKLDFLPFKKKISNYEYYKKKVLNKIKIPEQKMNIPYNRKESESQTLTQKNGTNNRKKYKNYTPIRMFEELNFRNSSKKLHKNIHQIVFNKDSLNSFHSIKFSNLSKDENKLSNNVSKPITKDQTILEKVRKEIKSDNYLKYLQKNLISYDRIVKVLKDSCSTKVIKKQKKEIKDLIDNSCSQQIRAGNMNLTIETKSRLVLNQPYKIPF